MKRQALLGYIGTLLLGVAIGWLLRPERDPCGGRPPSADYAQDIEVIGPDTRTTVYRPHSVLVNERIVFSAPDHSAPEVPVTKFHFEDGAVKVACTEVTGSR